MWSYLAFVSSWNKRGPRSFRGPCVCVCVVCVQVVAPWHALCRHAQTWLHIHPYKHKHTACQGVCWFANIFSVFQDIWPLSYHIIMDACMCTWRFVCLCVKESVYVNLCTWKKVCVCKCQCVCMCKCMCLCAVSTFFVQPFSYFLFYSVWTEFINRSAFINIILNWHQGLWQNLTRRKHFYCA